jgi:hypothetical protein
MDDQIKVLWMPKARAMGFILKPMLERSYEMFLKNNRKDVVSEYVGGNCLVVTTVTPDGQVTQIALCREEIEDLPQAMRDQIKKDLKRPAKKGWFTGKL